MRGPSLSAPAWPWGGEPAEKLHNPIVNYTPHLPSPSAPGNPASLGLGACLSHTPLSMSGKAAARDLVVVVAAVELEQGNNS